MRILIIVLLVAGCAKKIEQLAPIKCVGEGECPAGYTCVDDECVTPRLDLPCESQLHDVCGLTEPPSSCVLVDERKVEGVCARHCDDNTPCPEGRICAAGAGVCFTDCTNGEACPNNMECAPVDNATTMVCIPTNAPDYGGECFSDETCRQRHPGAVCISARQDGDGYGTCQRGCASSADCNPDSETCGFVVPNAPMFCMKNCASAADCAAGYTCPVSTCIPPVLKAHAVGEGCEIGPDCSAIERGVCVLVDGVSLCESTCGIDDRCHGDYVCSSGVCVPPTSAGCSAGGNASLGLPLLAFAMLRRRRRAARDRSSARRVA